MNRDNKLYLHNIANKVQYYFNIRKKAIKYISDHNLIHNKDLCVSVMLISALWAANKRNETLTEDDLVIFFGLESVEENSFSSETISLSEEHKHLSLKELQDITVESFGDAC